MSSHTQQIKKFYKFENFVVQLWHEINFFVFNYQFFVEAGVSK